MLKILISFFVFTLSLGVETLAQYGYAEDFSAKYKPFQVIYGEDVTAKATSEPLTKWQLLGVREEVVLGKNGYLILGHFSGYLYEFEGDTSLSIGNLADQVKSELNFTTASERFLFDPEKFSENIRAKLSSYGAVTICRPSEIILNVAEEAGAITLSRSKPVVCLSWEIVDKEASVNHIAIKNIFDETLEMIDLENTEIQLDFTQYVEEIPKLLLLEFIGYRSGKKAQESLHMLGVNLDSQTHFSPNSCEINSAIGALEMAFYHRHSLSKEEAVNYFKLAATLSDRPFFKEMLKQYDPN